MKWKIMFLMFFINLLKLEIMFFVLKIEKLDCGPWWKLQGTNKFRIRSSLFFVSVSSFVSLIVKNSSLWNLSFVFNEIERVQSFEVLNSKFNAREFEWVQRCRFDKRGAFNRELTCYVYLFIKCGNCEFAEVLIASLWRY